MSEQDPTGRLVWITQEQRDKLYNLAFQDAVNVVDAFDAAPADPVEAVEEALKQRARASFTRGRTVADYDELAEAVLGALGWET